MVGEVVGGTETSLEVCRDCGGEGFPAVVVTMLGIDGSGGRGIAGGGEGKLAMEADFRRLDVIEFDR